MVDTVDTEVQEEEKSYDDAFDDMWEDSEEGPKLEAQEEEVPEETPEEVPQQAAPDDPYAWIEGLPEEQRGMAERLRHEALSDRGRVSALTRKNNEITAELARVHPTPVVIPEEVTPAQAQQPSDNIRQLQEDYPELGKQLSHIWDENTQKYERL